MIPVDAKEVVIKLTKSRSSFAKDSTDAIFPTYRFDRKEATSRSVPGLQAT